MIHREKFDVDVERLKMKFMKSVFKDSKSVLI